MAVEAKRGCGYRKVGGLYLVADGPGVECDRLPIPLHVCPTCGAGIKQARGWTWVDFPALVSGVHLNCEDEFPCPLCMAPQNIGRAGLLWIGEKFYATPALFDVEAKHLGISRRIAAVPRGFKVGETWVLLAHSKAFAASNMERTAGIFRAFKPARIEKIVTESMTKDEAEMTKLRESGITPVVVPDSDPDHQGSVYDEEKNGELFQ